MSKRLTARNKWADPWFRELSPKQKCLWLWMLDTCDCAGVLPEIDWGLVSFQIGQPCTAEDLKPFEGRFEACRGGIWIRKFVAFQLGSLNQDKPSAPQVGVIKALARASIPLEKVLETLPEPLAKGSESLSEGLPKAPESLKYKYKYKDKDKDESGEGVGEEQGSPSPEMIYQAYPRKVGKAEATRAIAKAIKSGAATPERLLERVQAYAKAVALWPAGDEQFIPYPASWFNAGRYDDDPNTWQRNPIPGIKSAPAPFARENKIHGYDQLTATQAATQAATEAGP